MRAPELIIPEDITHDNLPDLLRNWYLGSRARRHLSGRRFETVTGLLGEGKECGRALDVGCGWGYNLYLLGRRGFDAYGIDIVQDDFIAARRISEANAYSITLVGADVGALPFGSGTFDVVAAVETLEHIYAPDRENAIGQIAGVLIPGGILALSTPNYYSLVEIGKRLIVRIPFLKRLFPPMCYPIGDVPREGYHPYRYHRPIPAGDLKDLLEGEGFSVIEMRKIIFVLKNVPDILFPLCRALEAVFEHIPLLRELGSTLVVSARKDS